MLLLHLKIRHTTRLRLSRVLTALLPPAVQRRLETLLLSYFLWCRLWYLVQLCSVDLQRPFFISTRKFCITLTASLDTRATTTTSVITVINASWQSRMLWSIIKMVRLLLATHGISNLIVRNARFNRQSQKGFYRDVSSMVVAKKSLRKEPSAPDCRWTTSGCRKETLSRATLRSHERYWHSLSCYGRNVQYWLSKSIAFPPFISYVDLFIESMGSGVFWEARCRMDGGDKQEIRRGGPAWVPCYDGILSSYDNAPEASSRDGDDYQSHGHGGTDVRRNSKNDQGVWYWSIFGITFLFPVQHLRKSLERFIFPWTCGRPPINMHF